MGFHLVLLPRLIAATFSTQCIHRAFNAYLHSGRFEVNRIVGQAITIYRHPHPFTLAANFLELPRTSPRITQGALCVYNTRREEVDDRRKLMMGGEVVGVVVSRRLFIP